MAFFPFAIFLFHLPKDPSSLGPALLPDGIVVTKHQHKQPPPFFLKFEDEKVVYPEKEAQIHHCPIYQQ